VCGERIAVLLCEAGVLVHSLARRLTDGWRPKDELEAERRT